MNKEQRISDEGLRMLRRLEGSRAHAYPDQRGLLTIGVGHLLTESELMSGKIAIGNERVRWRNGLTDEQINELFRQDLEWAQNAVRTHTIPLLRQNQFDALVSFVFNVGSEAFRESTLLKRINSGQFTEVPFEMRKWKYAGGRVEEGLVNRREVEIDRWQARTA